MFRTASRVCAQRCWHRLEGFPDDSCQLRAQHADCELAYLLHIAITGADPPEKRLQLLDKCSSFLCRPAIKYEWMVRGITMEMDLPHIWIGNDLHQSRSRTIQVYQTVVADHLALGGVLGGSIRSGQPRYSPAPPGAVGYQRPDLAGTHYRPCRS